MRECSPPPPPKHVKCHMSHATTCHDVSHVTCHVSHVFFFRQSGEAYRWRVCYQWGLPRLVEYYLYLIHKNLINENPLSLNVAQRWKNEQACKQRLCKLFSILGKICAKFYVVLSQKSVMLRFCASCGNTFGF